MITSLCVWLPRRQLKQTNITATILNFIRYESFLPLVVISQATTWIKETSYCQLFDTWPNSGRHFRIFSIHSTISHIFLDLATTLGDLASHTGRCSLGIGKYGSQWSEGDWTCRHLRLPSPRINSKILKEKWNILRNLIERDVKGLNLPFTEWNCCEVSAETPPKILKYGNLQIILN